MLKRPLQTVRDLFCSSRNLIGLGRAVSLLILAISVTLGLSLPHDRCGCTGVWRRHNGSFHTR